MDLEKEQVVFVKQCKDNDTMLAHTSIHASSLRRAVETSATTWTTT
jgi:hypothetical protein